MAAGGRPPGRQAPRPCGGGVERSGRASEGNKWREAAFDAAVHRRWKECDRNRVDMADRPTTLSLSLSVQSTTRTTLARCGLEIPTTEFVVLVRSAFCDSETREGAAAAANGKREEGKKREYNAGWVRAIVRWRQTSGWPASPPARPPVRSAPLNISRTLQRDGTMRCIDSGREKGRGRGGWSRRSALASTHRRPPPHRRRLLDGRTLLKCEISARAKRREGRPGERTMTDRLAPEERALIFLPTTNLIETSCWSRQAAE